MQTATAPLAETAHQSQHANWRWHLFLAQVGGLRCCCAQGWPGLGSWAGDAGWDVEDDGPGDQRAPDVSDWADGHLSGGRGPGAQAPCSGGCCGPASPGPAADTAEAAAWGQWRGARLGGNVAFPQHVLRVGTHPQQSPAVTAVTPGFRELSPQSQRGSCLPRPSTGPALTLCWAPVQPLPTLLGIVPLSTLLRLFSPNVGSGHWWAHRAAS